MGFVRAHAGSVSTDTWPGMRLGTSAGAFGLDPRLIQIATLSTLLVCGVLLFGVQASVWQAAVTILTGLAVQTVCSLVLGMRPDLRSPLITGLSLTLLLRANDPWLWAAAAGIGVGSKFVLRWRGKHLFNPACLAIVLLLETGWAWVSPGQWGPLAWGAAGLACAGGLVLSRVGRADTAVTFLGSYAALLAARCLALGDPWTIPLHQMQSGALLVFTFFMITDPRTTPDSRAGRMLFAMAVAALAYHLQFVWQVREGLFYALALVSCATPLIDLVLPASRFRWRSIPQEARCASFP